MSYVYCVTVPERLPSGAWSDMGRFLNQINQNYWVVRSQGSCVVIEFEFKVFARMFVRKFSDWCCPND